MIEAADELTDFGRVPRLGATEVEKGRGDGAEILRPGVGDRVGAIRAEMPQCLGLWRAGGMRGAGAKWVCINNVTSQSTSGHLSLTTRFRHLFAKLVRQLGLSVYQRIDLRTHNRSESQRTAEIDHELDGRHQDDGRKNRICIFTS